MKLLTLTLVATVLAVSSSANAHLLSRLGGQAYYNDEADLTWLADANAGAGSVFDDGQSTIDGRMSWANANDWAASLSINGVSGWRLANTVDVGNDGYTYTNFYQGVDFGYNITAASELSNMFYSVLGGVGYYDTSGNIQSVYGISNTSPFSNLQSNGYWSATEYAPYAASNAWYFDMASGGQNYIPMDVSSYAWAVQSGDVGAVPVPAAVWLFGSGLVGLIGLARRKR